MIISPKQKVENTMPRTILTDEHWLKLSVIIVIERSLSSTDWAEFSLFCYLESKLQ